MHPQCITEPSVDAALKRAKSPSGAIEEGDAGLLADELLRLREELNVERGVRSALEQACSQDMAKLARVEALADALDRSGNLTVVASIRKALSDPQPSAAPTPPKKGEPYNGW